MLYIFAGLPGSGKTTLAQGLAQVSKAVYLRIDTLEQALRDLAGISPQGEGYELAYRLASEQLKLGLDVIADSCNPIELTRERWQQVAHEAGADCINIEVSCSDPGEHQLRVETRQLNIPGLVPPSWQEVQAREYHLWSGQFPRISIDTAGRSSEQSLDELLSKLGLKA